LPLIVAAQLHLPLILRDIPVFREVAGGAGFYFPGETAANTAQYLKDWLALYQSDQHPKTIGLSYQLWQQSVEQIRVAMALI
jgi:hypothetical protein